MGSSTEKEDGDGGDGTSEEEDARVGGAGDDNGGEEDVGHDLDVVVLGMVEAVEVIHGNLDRYPTKQAPRNTTATPRRKLTTFLVRV